MLRLRWILMVCLLSSTLAFASPMTEPEKIEALIHGVEVMPGTPFIRNGTAYDGKAAAEHLRLKLRNAGNRVHTAEQFIAYCATGSSMSGAPYQVRLADGKTENAEVYFHAELRRIDAAPDEASTKQ